MQKALYRGDCYICQFTHRMNRNFQDPTSPTNDVIVARGACDFGVARPLYYELGATGIVGSINTENAIQADIRGLNSKVGQISNKAASLYAMLKFYDKHTTEYFKIYSSIIVLGEIVGMEIDRIKTGVKPTLPLEWKPYQIEWRKGNNIYDDDVMITSEPEAQGIYRHNDLVPDVKPYFLKYNYQYLDRDIRQLKTACNSSSVINFGMKLDDLIAECESGNGTDEMMSLYRLYYNTYPVIDTDCVVNHISHLFEQVHFDLHKQISSEGRDMLKDFISDKPTDKETLIDVCNVYNGYKRFLRVKTKKARSNWKDGNKNIKSHSSDIFESVREHYKGVIHKICGTYQNAFDYLVFLPKGYEKIVWDLLGDNILQVVRKKG